MHLDLTGYNEVSADGNQNLTPGGYVCKIISVKQSNSKANNPMLYVDIDIAEGQFAGYFLKETKKFQKSRSDATWSSNGRFSVVIRFPGEKNIFWRLKNFLVAVEKSNPDFRVDPQRFDDQSLVSKLCGFVFKGKEAKAIKNDGTHYVNAIVAFPVSVEDIRDGDFTVPDTIPYVDDDDDVPANNTFTGTPIDDNDTPF